MSWFNSSSLSGLLSQAQQSIDKVLDIPLGNDDKSKKTGQNLDSGKSQATETQEKKKSEQKESSSLLSGQDSFWGSFTQNVSSSLNKDSAQSAEKSPYDLKTKNKSSSEKSNDLPEKESKLSSKPMNLKRNNKKKVSKKKVNAGNSRLNESLATSSTHENEGEDKPKRLSDLKVQSNEIKNNKDADVIDAKVESVSKDTSDSETCKVLNNDNSTVNESSSVKAQTELEVTKDAAKIEDVSMTENLDVASGQEEKQENLELADGTMKQVEKTELHKKLKQLENDRNTTGAMEDKVSENVELQINEANENLSGKNDVEPEREQEWLAESIQNSDLFSSVPVAASTPQKKEPSDNNTENSGSQEPLQSNTGDDEQFGNINDLLKESEIPPNQNIEHGLDVEEKAEEDVNEMTIINKEMVVKAEVGNLTSNQENERLCQIIEVREAKVVELSKENLNLQETNAILRSQIEQLEEVHKSEDAELEEMKEEFTKRIGESETKLQAAAQERDLFKKRLEETQKCLSSDIERQLVEFQSLLQEKDEQIAQLMEEGEKLSKQVLQRNTNIKKLRTKEKELSTSNESLSTRLEAAESEIERLTGILKERDEHEKEQNDAIKKLNAHIKKQEDVISKQKVELEESAAKLPSLQTALDNAYKEITELHKVNAAKSTEVQEATLSVEMTAKEELRIALEKLKKESQKECDVLAMEVTDLQTQLNRNEQQAARREDNLRQEIADIQMRLQEAESRNQELTQSVSVATRPLLRQIENLQHSYGSQQTSWEKLEKTLTERLSDAQSQLATAQEKERASTQRSMELTSKVASLESQVANYRQEKSRIEAEFELERAKLEALEDFKSRESVKVEALKSMHKKQMETMIVEKSLLEQQLAVERTKYESEQKKLTKLEEQMNQRRENVENIAEAVSEETTQHATLERRRSRNSSSSSVFSLSDTVTRSIPSGGTAVLEELRATIRHKEGELISMQSAVSTLESSRESLTEELTSLMNTNENLSEENKQLRHMGKSFQELQTKYNALLQMYGEKQEETEELKLDLQDIKSMYKAQIQELLSER